MEGPAMCEPHLAFGSFDPSSCPLLMGLSPEEQWERMQNDPHIVACIAAQAGGAPAHSRTLDADMATTGMPNWQS